MINKIKEWRVKNPDKFKEQKKRYRKKHQEKYPDKHKEKQRMSDLKQRMRKRGIIPPYDPKNPLTEEQLNNAITEYKKIIKAEWDNMMDGRIITRFRNRAMESARRKGYDFDLDRCDIIIPITCRYLNTTLDYSSDPKNLIPDENKPSLDRIDSSKGYIKGNIQIISLMANKIKTSATKEQLINFAAQILLENSTNS